MYLVDYHTHPFSHGEIINYNKDLYKKYVKRAMDVGIKEIGFSDHDEYDQKINFDIIDSLKNKSSIPVLKGLEIDYVPGREEEILQKINKYNLDYTIGSVHFIGDWAFDHPDHINQYNTRDIDQSYIEYFNILNNAVQSGLFNIIGHFDLIKVFGFKTNLNIMEIIKPVLENIKKNGLVLEINTNGLNKPINEIYPSLKIIKKAHQLKIPITFGSDAHIPNRVGENIYKYSKIIKDIGYKEVAVFRNGNLLFKSI